MNILTLTRKGMRRLVADLNPDAGAKGTRWAGEAAVVNAKLTRHGVTREPDIFDEVTEQAIWFGDGFTVIVNFDRLDAFRAWIATRCLAPCGQGSYSLDYLATADVGWERLFATVKA